MHIVLLCSDWANQIESKAHDTDFKEIGMIPFHSLAFREEQAYKFFPPNIAAFITIKFEVGFGHSSQQKMIIYD